MDKKKLQKIAIGIARTDTKSTVKSLEVAQKRVQEFKKQIESIFSLIADLKEELKKSEGELSSALNQKLRTLQSAMTEYKSANLERLGVLSSNMDGLKKDIKELSNKKTELPDLQNQIKEVENALKGTISDLNENNEKRLEEVLTNSQKAVTDLSEELKKLRRDTMSAMANRGGSMNRQINVNSSVISTRYADINLVAGANLTLTTSNDNVNKRANLSLGVSSVISSINSITSTFANDGINYTIPQSRNILQFFDQNTGSTIGKLLVGHTGISTDFFGYAFYGLDDISGIGNVGFLGGLSGYGTLMVTGDYVQSGFGATTFDNSGNYFTNTVSIGRTPLATNPNDAVLYVKYTDDVNGVANTNILSIADSSGSHILDITDKHKLHLDGGLHISQVDIAIDATLHSIDLSTTQYCNIALNTSDGGSDYIEQIDGIVEGNIIILGQGSFASTVTVKHGTGNIVLNDNQDRQLQDQEDFIVLVGNSNGTMCEIGQNMRIGSSGITGGVSGDILSLLSGKLSSFNIFSTANTFSAVQSFSSGIITGKLYPSADSTTALQIYKADGTTNILTVDTTNKRIGIGNTPQRALDVFDASNPAIRITRTANNIYCDMQVDANGNINFYPTSGNGSDGRLIIQSNGVSCYIQMAGLGTNIGYLSASVTDSGTNPAFGVAISNGVGGPLSVRRAWAISNGGYIQTVDAVGRIAIGSNTTPTAYLHLPAGSTAASSGGIKFTSGSLMTTAEVGALEFLTDKFYATISTGAARKEFTLNDAALTSGTIPIATTNGRLTDSTFTISSNKFTSYNNVALEGLGLLGVVDDVSLTNQGADITATNFTNAQVAGTYMIMYTLQDTTSDLTAGAITLTIAWTDGAGATTATANQVLTGVGRTSGVIHVQEASGNLTYAVAHTGIFGSAKYALYMSCIRLS